jgi:hypothetical protein
MIFEAKRPKTARVPFETAAGGYEFVAPETRTAQLALPRFSALGSNRSEELWLQYRVARQAIAYAGARRRRAAAHAQSKACANSAELGRAIAALLTT